MPRTETDPRVVFDLRNPTFTGILLTLHEAALPLTARTIRDRVGRADVVRVLEAMNAEGAITHGDPSTAGTPRWVLTEAYGLRWAIVATERGARLATKSRRRPYHYGDAHGDGRPPEEHWCDWCAGFYGVPHDIAGPSDWAGTHHVGALCHHSWGGGWCACIDCATLRNDRTILTYQETR